MCVFPVSFLSNEIDCLENDGNPVCAENHPTSQSRRPTGGRASHPDAPRTEGGHHVDNDLGDCLVLVRIEDSKSDTFVLRRHRLLLLDVRCPAVLHRLIPPVLNRYPVDLWNGLGNRSGVSLEEPEDGIPEILVCRGIGGGWNAPPTLGGY